MKLTSIQADWKKLLLVNYKVDPEILEPYVPYCTHIALWDNACYVSLVGFLFHNVKIAGVPIPFHRNFIEINLRFYVRREHKDDWRYGVVFIKEIVSVPMVAIIAKTIAKENYSILPVKHSIVSDENELKVGYSWKKQQWHSFDIHCEPHPIPMIENSPEDFLTSQHWGYTKVNAAKTFEYSVVHPKWKMYKTKSSNIHIDFGKVYGDRFAFLTRSEPDSVFLAEGSPIFMEKYSTIR